MTGLRHKGANQKHVKVYSPSEKSCTLGTMMRYVACDPDFAGRSISVRHGNEYHSFNWKHILSILKIIDLTMKLQCVHAFQIKD